MQLLRRDPRSLWPAGLILAGALFLGAGFAPLPIGGEAAVQSLTAQLSERTGLIATAEPDDIRFSLLPFPKVRIENLTISTPSGLKLARAPRLHAYLRPLDFVAGRFRFSGYDLRDPIADASTNEARTAWRAAGAALTEAGGQTPAPAIAELAMSGGVIVTEAGPLTDLTATVSWPGGGSPVSIWARGRWKGEEASLRLSEFRPDAYLGAIGSTPVRIAARSPFGNLDATGVIVADAAPRFEGEAKLDMLSAERFGRWLHIAPPLVGVLDRYVVQGSGSATTRGFSSPAIAMTIGGGRVEGTMALRIDAERPRLSGTLATQALDFDTLGDAVDAVRDSGGTWSADSFDPTPLRRIDVDLRLSAQRVRLLGAKLDDAAISIMLNAGKLEFVLGRAQAYDGALRGRASLQALDGDRVEAKLQANIENVDAGAALNDLLGKRLLSGRAQGHVQVETNGRSPAEFVQQLSGKAAAQVKEGEINGVSLLDAARRSDRLSNSAVELGRGRTPFASLDVASQIARGVADVIEATLTSAGVTARASGEASLVNQTLRLDGRARATGLPIDGLPFSLRGAFRLPELRWDLAQPFKRS